MNILHLASFVDASFASKKDMSSQLEYLLALIDAESKENIIDYASYKSRRVTRSVLTAELFALIDVFDITGTMRVIVNTMLGRTVDLEAYVDRESFYDCVVDIESSTEKRLLIDLDVL